MKLIVCGNGLDIHVGLDTSYRSYRKFLENRDIYSGKNAIKLIENSTFFIPRDVECWTDLESALSFDCKKYISEYVNAFDRDTDPNEYETCKAQIKAASDFLKESPLQIAKDFTNTWFWEWLANQYYKNIDAVCENNTDDILHEIIECDSICINFNYTHTLEDFLHLKQQQILYIHNRLPDKRNLMVEKFDFEKDVINAARKQFQFGSVRNNIEDWEKQVDSLEIKSSGKLIDKKQLKKDIKEIYWAFSKKLTMNYDSLKKFIDLYIDNISEIVILGHSILGVDEQYYKDIVVPKLGNRKWTIYYHDKKSEENARVFADRYNLKTIDFLKW